MASSYMGYIPDLHHNQLNKLLNENVDAKQLEENNKEAHPFSSVSVLIHHYCLTVVGGELINTVIPTGYWKLLHSLRSCANLGRGTAAWERLVIC